MTRRSPKGLLEQVPPTRTTEDIVEWVRWTLEDHVKQAKGVLDDHSVKPPKDPFRYKREAEDRSLADPPYFALHVLDACRRAKKALTSLGTANDEAVQLGCWLAQGLYEVKRLAADMETTGMEPETYAGKGVIEGGRKSATQRHGTPEEHQAKLEERRAAVARYEKDRSRGKAIEAAARKLGLHPRTIKRALQ